MDWLNICIAWCMFAAHCQIQINLVLLTVWKENFSVTMQFLWSLLAHKEWVVQDIRLETLEQPINRSNTWIVLWMIAKPSSRNIDKIQSTHWLERGRSVMNGGVSFEFVGLKASRTPRYCIWMTGTTNGLVKYLHCFVHVCHTLSNTDQPCSANCFKREFQCYNTVSLDFIGS